MSRVSGWKLETRFRCVACGKLTAGRISREGRDRGDKTARFPRHHASDQGDPCPGIYTEAEWVDVKPTTTVPADPPAKDVRGRLT